MKRPNLCLRAAIMAAGILSANALNAQPWNLVPASNADNIIYSDATAPAVMEAAAIAYPGSPSNGGLFATACYGGVNAGIFIKDIDPLGSSTFITGTYLRPDVVIGNNGATDFYVAVSSYVASPGGTSQIDYFPVNYTGWGTFTIGSSPSPTTVPGALVRMDVIAEEGNTGLTGLPLVDKFVVGWLNGGDIYVEMPSFSSIPGSLTGTAVTSTSDVVFYDIAGVQRYVSHAVHDIALISYTNIYNELWYVEYDFTTSTASSPIQHDWGTGSPTYYGWPRIAAHDAYSSSTYPMWNSFSHYKIAVSVPGQAEIRTYDNLTYAGGTGTYWDCAQVVDVSGWPPYSGYSSGYTHFFPAITTRSFNPWEFLVMHTTELHGGDQLVFMEPIDGGNPWDIIYNPGTASWDYYMVNRSYPLAQAGNYSNAIASPPNELVSADWVVSAWSSYNGSGWDAFYKLAPVSGFTYSYKQPSGVKEATDNKLQVYPNPASDNLMIAGSQSDLYATRYDIVDMTGRVVQHGNFKNEAKNIIDIHTLPPGAYMLNLYNRQIRAEHMRFVKGE